MAPATNLGAATPVAIGLPGSRRRDARRRRSGPRGVERAGKPVGRSRRPAADAMTAKQVNDAAAYIRGLAQLRGRNAEWAEQAVREAVSLTAAEALARRRDRPGRRRPARPAGASSTAARVELARRRAEPGHAAAWPRSSSPPDWRHRLLSVIANPSIALILMMIGIYGLIFEFSSPGFGVPGMVGAICLLLALFALQMLPVNYAGLALIAARHGAAGRRDCCRRASACSASAASSPSSPAALLLFDTRRAGLRRAAAADRRPGGRVGGAGAARRRHGRCGRAARPVVSGREALLGAHGRGARRSTATQAWALVHGERWRVRGAAAAAAGPARARAARATA